jgi:hypothetical protein
MFGLLDDLQTKHKAALVRQKQLREQCKTAEAKILPLVLRAAASRNSGSPDHIDAVQSLFDCADKLVVLGKESEIAGLEVTKADQAQQAESKRQENSLRDIIKRCDRDQRRITEELERAMKQADEVIEKAREAREST